MQIFWYSIDWNESYLNFIHKLIISTLTLWQWKITIGKKVIEKNCFAFIRLHFDKALVWNRLCEIVSIRARRLLLFRPQWEWAYVLERKIACQFCHFLEKEKHTFVKKGKIIAKEMLLYNAIVSLTTCSQKRRTSMHQEWLGTARKTLIGFWNVL